VQIEEHPGGNMVASFKESVWRETLFLNVEIRCAWRRVSGEGNSWTTRPRSEKLALRIGANSERGWRLTQVFVVALYPCARRVGVDLNRFRRGCTRAATGKSRGNENRACEESCCSSPHGAQPTHGSFKDNH